MVNEIVSLFKNNGFEQVLCNEEGTVKSNNWFFRKIGIFEFRAFVLHESLPMLFSFENYLNDEKLDEEFSRVLLREVNDISFFLSRAFQYNAALNDVIFKNPQLSYSSLANVDVSLFKA